jgi:hypothetical protein
MAPATAPAAATAVVTTVVAVVARPAAVSLFSIGREKAIILCRFLTVFCVVAGVDLELFQFDG